MGAKRRLNSRLFKSTHVVKNRRGPVFQVFQWFSAEVHAKGEVSGPRRAVKITVAAFFVVIPAVSAWLAPVPDRNLPEELPTSVSALANLTILSCLRP